MLHRCPFCYKDLTHEEGCPIESHYPVEMLALFCACKHVAKIHGGCPADTINDEDWPCEDGCSKKSAATCWMDYFIEKAVEE